MQTLFLTFKDVFLCADCSRNIIALTQVTNFIFALIYLLHTDACAKNLYFCISDRIYDQIFNESCNKPMKFVTCANNADGDSHIAASRFSLGC